MSALIGRKVGMTQIYTKEGTCYGVTVVDVGSNVVVQKKSAKGRDKYTAVKLGFSPVHQHVKEGAEPRWRMSKPLVGVFQKAGVAVPRKFVREFRVEESQLDKYTVGQELGVEQLRVGQYVDVIGQTKGRGFTGAMKRHNFHGARSDSHGTHEYFRHVGSIGASTFPGQVIKGKRMEGHYGDERVTIQNLHVVDILAEQNLVLVKGAIPGPNGGVIMLRAATKKPKAHKNPGTRPG